MTTHTQPYQGAIIEVICDGNHCTARRIEHGESVPRWSYLLCVTMGRGSNDAYPPVFDLAAGTVDLHVCALGGTGHEPWEEAWATLSLENGAVLHYRDAGG